MKPFQNLMTKRPSKVLTSIIIYILIAKGLLAVALYLLNLLPAVSVTLDKEITICSIYIPPSFSLKPEHLDSLLKQLPSPYLLLGDFNAHNIFWGSKENNSRGELIENFITNNDICLMNDKSNTYMHYPIGSFSSKDLSLCHLSLFLDFNWTVCKDQHHSDHFPIVIKSNTSTVEDHNPKWKLSKANWEVFQSST